MGLGTYFACTNGDTASVSIGVEVFGQAGTSANNPLSTAVSIAPQASVLFGTTAAAGVSTDVNLLPGAIQKGSAHILATSKKVVCTAFVIDPFSNPPISMVNLTIAAKGKQKGD